jgi:hypothetical protein
MASNLIESDTFVSALGVGADSALPATRSVRMRNGEAGRSSADQRRRSVSRNGIGRWPFRLTLARTSAPTRRKPSNGIVIRSGGSFRMPIDGWGKLSEDRRRSFIMAAAAVTKWPESDLAREFDRITAAGGNVYEVTW